MWTYKDEVELRLKVRNDLRAVTGVPPLEAKDLIIEDICKGKQALPRPGHPFHPIYMKWYNEQINNQTPGTAEDWSNYSEV